MKRLGTILAIALGTAIIMMLVAIPTDAKTFAKASPVIGNNGPVTVDVWTDRAEGSVYNPGESIALYFYASADCYVTIYDIETDGRVKILFPEYPDDGFVFGGMTYRLPEYYRHGSLIVDGSRGIEYIQAVATRTPGAFRYRSYGGSYHHGINPVTGDPFEAMNYINGQIIRREHIASTATTWFFVGGRVWYPRYMCGSCHGRASSFDPYRDACPRYSVHVAGGYDYWWNYSYYPKVGVHFSFGGPFWKFELRTIPFHRHRHIRYIDVAYGHNNYYCPKPPRRPYKHIPQTTSRTYVRRDRVKAYEPVRYGEVRSRKDTRDPRTRTYTNSSSRTSPTRTTHSRTTTSTAPSSRSTRTTTSSAPSRSTRTTTSTAPSSRSRASTNLQSTTSGNRTGSSSRYDGTSTSTGTRTYNDGSSSSRSPATAPSTSRTREGTGTTTRDERTTVSSRSVAPAPQTQSVPNRTPAKTETRARSRSIDIQTSRIPSAPKSKATPSRSTSTSRSPGSDSRSRQQSSSSSSSRSSTRTR